MLSMHARGLWIPACAGMTSIKVARMEAQMVFHEAGDKVIAVVVRRVTP
jgi:hypothetical protein